MNAEKGRASTLTRLSLRAVLAELVERCDGQSGVRADGSNIDTSAAHAVLAASPVEQPAAAPIDGVVGPLRDDQRQHAISLYLNLPHSWESAQAVINSVSADAYVNGRKDAAPAPSPADERAALLNDDEYCDLQAAVQALELIASGLTYAKDHDLDGTMQKATIRDAMRHAKNALRRLNPVYHKLADTWQEARAASANETGAEGAADLEERAHLAAGQWANSNTPIAEALAYRDGFIAGARSPAMAAEAVAIPAGWKAMPPSATTAMRMAMAEAAAEYMRRTGGNSPDAIYEAGFAAAPQPAQADAQDVPADDLVGFVYVLENPDRPHDPVTRFSRRPLGVRSLGAKIVSLTPVYSRPAQADGVPECNGSHDAGQIAAGEKECTACGGE